MNVLDDVVSCVDVETGLTNKTQAVRMKTGAGTRRNTDKVSSSSHTSGEKYFARNYLLRCQPRYLAITHQQRNSEILFSSSVR